MFSGNGDGCRIVHFIVRKRVAHSVRRIWDYFKKIIIIKLKAVPNKIVLIEVLTSNILNTSRRKYNKIKNILKNVKKGTIF